MNLRGARRCALMSSTRLDAVHMGVPHRQVAEECAEAGFPPADCGTEVQRRILANRGALTVRAVSGDRHHLRRDDFQAYVCTSAGGHTVQTRCLQWEAAGVLQEFFQRRQRFVLAKSHLIETRVSNSHAGTPFSIRPSGRLPRTG